MARDCSEEGSSQRDPLAKMRPESRVPFARMAMRAFIREYVWPSHATAFGGRQLRGIPKPLLELNGRSNYVRALAERWMHLLGGIASRKQRLTVYHPGIPLNAGAVRDDK